MTRDDIIRLAREAMHERFSEGGYWFSMEVKDLERFAALVAAHEREACAKVCDGWLHANGDDCADAIRARGET